MEGGVEYLDYQSAAGHLSATSLDQPPRKALGAGGSIQTGIAIFNKQMAVGAALINKCSDGLADETFCFGIARQTV